MNSCFFLWDHLVQTCSNICLKGFYDCGVFLGFFMSCASLNEECFAELQEPRASLYININGYWWMSMGIVANPNSAKSFTCFISINPPLTVWTSLLLGFSSHQAAIHAYSLHKELKHDIARPFVRKESDALLEARSPERFSCWLQVFLFGKRVKWLHLDSFGAFFPSLRRLN